MLDDLEFDNFFDDFEDAYESKEMQKFLPKIKDEQVKLTGMPITKHFLLIGGTGAGKSKSLFEYLKRTMSAKYIKNPTFKTIHYFYQKEEAILLRLKEALEDYVYFYSRIEDFPDVKKFQSINSDNKDQHLIIFDDFVTDKNKQNLKKIQDYLIFGRGRGCTVALLSQSYFQTDILLRKNLSFVLLVSATGKDLNRILNDFEIKNLDKKGLEKIFEGIKKTKAPNFMKINTEVLADENKKISRNFLDYVNLDKIKKNKSNLDKIKTKSNDPIITQI